MMLSAQKNSVFMVLTFCCLAGLPSWPSEGPIRDDFVFCHFHPRCAVFPFVPRSSASPTLVHSSSIEKSQNPTQLGAPAFAFSFLSLSVHRIHRGVQAATRARIRPSPSFSLSLLVNETHCAFGPSVEEDSERFRVVLEPFPSAPPRRSTVCIAPRCAIARRLS